VVMDFRKQKLSIAEAKEMDMVQYLSLLGYEPSKIRNNDYWYRSPLREEKTPSFKVNRKLNRWYDHGLGKGGNMIDFGIAHYGCSVGEFLNKLNGRSSFQAPLKSIPKRENEPEHQLKILKEVELSSYALIRYLKQRKIPVEIATQYCWEVHYEVNGKNYYGIGFKNDSGGFEIRNPYFKASSSPKDITTIKSGSKEVAVFEGFTDFLSLRALHKNLTENSQDIVVLNSVSFFERARPFMEKHQAIQLYLDRDATGQNLTQRALSMSTKYIDKSSLYKNHKDLNDWLIHIGKQPKKRLGNKL